LITLNQLEAETFARANKIEFENFAELTKNQQIFNSINETVERANAKISSSEQIKKFAILERDFSLENDEITPTLKLKRNIVSERFKDEIERMYL
jgi:long-chain acyl-CoA synthetase